MGCSTQNLSLKKAKGTLCSLTDMGRLGHPLPFTCISVKEPLTCTSARKPDKHKHTFVSRKTWLVQSRVQGKGEKKDFLLYSCWYGKGEPTVVMQLRFRKRTRINWRCLTTLLPPENLCAVDSFICNFGFHFCEWLKEKKMWPDQTQASCVPAIWSAFLTPLLSLLASSLYGSIRWKKKKTKNFSEYRTSRKTKTLLQSALS